MNVRIVSSALLPFASAALCGTLALAQPPAPPAPSDSAGATQSPAPIERPGPGRRGPQFQGQPRSAMPGIRRGAMGADFGRGMRGMWWRNPMVAQQLNLTADQVRRMDGIFEQTRLQLIDLRANVEKQEVMLEPMLSANPVDTAKASAQIDKVAQARADLEKADAKMLLSIRGVLTPDQWTKLNDRRGPAAPAAAPTPPPAPGAPGAGPTGGPGRGGPGNGRGPAAPPRPLV